MGLQSVKVFAGATVANVACAFDILGFALSAPGDVVHAERSSMPGVRMREITGDGGVLPREAEKNTAGVAVLEFLKRVNISEGVELSLHKGMPLGSGLGSSAASAAAALFAANELFGRPLTALELLPCAIEAEFAACGARHADNVAPALLGGFVLIRSYTPLDVIELGPCPELHCAVWHPSIELRTEDARKVLKQNIPLSSAIEQWGNVAGLVTGLLKGDYDLIGRSLHDVLIEPVRSRLIPGFDKLKAIALQAGALGCSISGSGPSIFALSRTSSECKQVSEALEQCSRELQIPCEVFSGAVRNGGPEILERG